MFVTSFEKSKAVLRATEKLSVLVGLIFSKFNSSSGKIADSCNNSLFCLSGYWSAFPQANTRAKMQSWPQQNPNHGIELFKTPNFAL